VFWGVVIAPAVARETANSVERRDWIRIASRIDAIPFDLLDAGHGAGETECIALALSRDVRWIVLDDRSARLFAKSRNLPCSERWDFFVRPNSPDSSIP